MLIYPVVVLTLENEWAMSYERLLPLALGGFILFGAGALPAGWLGDRWSATGMMTVFFLGTGSAAIFTGLAQSPLQLGLGLGLIGLFASIYHPVGIAWLIKNAVNRGRALGFNGIFGSLGTAMAALIAAALTDGIGWRAAFLVPGAVAVMVGVVFFIAVRSGAVMEAESDTAPQTPPTRSDAVRAFIILFAAMITTGLIFQATSVSMPKLFALRLDGLAAYGAMGVGSLVSLVYLISMGAHLLGGYLSDRFSLKLVYLGSYAIQVPVLFAAAALDNMFLVFAAVLMVFFNVGSTPPENALLAHFTPAKWRSTAFGAKFVLSLGIGALGIPLVALVYDKTGNFSWLFIILGALAALVTVALLPLPSNRREAPAETVPVAAE